MMFDDLVIRFAYLTNNRWGKREDVHGRDYRYVYKKFGHQEMLAEYRYGNTWLIGSYLGSVGFLLGYLLLCYIFFELGRAV